MSEPEPEAVKASDAVKIGEVCETGVYIDLDSDTRQVVTKEPARGIQLLAPGTEATPDIVQAIRRAELASAGTSTVETATIDKASGTRRRS